MAALTTEISHDLDADVTVVYPAGRLNLTTAPALRAVLLKCIAECPCAVVVDLTDCTIASSAALAVFPAAAQHATEPVVAVLLCGMVGRIGHIPAAVGTLPVHRTLAEALAAAEEARHLQLRLRLRLPWSLSAPGTAREAVGDACEQWKLGDLRPLAELIVSELVTNAIRHAGTDVHVDAALRGPYLHLRVMDFNPAPPVMVAAPDGPALAEHGRGLPVVSHYCTAWGYLLKVGTGKVVWATLRTQPLGS